MNLIDANLQTIINQAMEDVFDTFARPITFTLFKNPEQTIVDINSDYRGSWNTGLPEIEYTEVKQDFPARIWFLDYEQQYKNFFLAGKELEGIRAIQELGQVKIQVKQDGYDFLKEATHAYFMNEMWEITSDVKAVGIINFDRFIFVLRRRK